MSIFDFSDYKLFVLTRIKAMPSHGRGELTRIASSVQMHTTSISQVFRGDKQLTPEQAAKLCVHWGMTELESEYLVTLVELERAGNSELKVVLKKRKAKLLEQSNNLVNRVPKDRVLSEADRSQFYSQWYYSAIRLLCDIPEYRSIDLLSTKLGLSLETVSEALQFLRTTGLIVEDQGVFKMGPKRTYLDATSPLISRHHINWRLKAIESYRQMDIAKDLALTAPMTLARADVVKVRDILVETIEKIMALNSRSDSEDLHFLNIDWLRI